MRPSIFTTDIHLTDHPQDAYRFGLFDKLCALVQERQLAYCFLLGDITDKTDRHPSTLVNHFTRNLKKLADLCQVFILRGNHDCVDPTLPYFQFLQFVPNIHYITSPARVNLDGTCILLLPHSREPEKEWATNPVVALDRADICFLHQTLNGSISENGTAMKGLPPEFFAGCKEIYSGDVHVPQRMGNLLYVGSPYHVHFGDTFKPVFRIRHQDGHIEDIPTGMPSRWMLNLLTVDEFGTRGVQRGDQVKIRLNISSEQWPQWSALQQNLRDQCTAIGAECFSIEPVVLDNKTVRSGNQEFLLEQQAPKQVIERFIKTKYPNLTAAYLQVGSELIKSVDGA